MRELAGTGLGEMHAVARPQQADLPFEIRAARGEIAVLVDEAVPHVDIGNPGLFGVTAIELVEIGEVRGRTSSANGRQSNPEHRHALALEDRDHLVDAPAVGLAPFFRAKLVGHHRAGRRLGGGSRFLRLGGFLRLGAGGTLWRIGGSARRIDLRRLPAFQLRLRRGRLLRSGPRRSLPDRLPVARSDHHHDEIGFLGREDFFGGLRPIEFLAGFSADQAAEGAVLAGNSDLRRLGERIFEAEAEPVGHGIAHDHHGLGGRTLRLARRRRPGGIDRRLWPLLGSRLPASPRPILALLRGLSLPPERVIPELRGCRRADDNTGRAREPNLRREHQRGGGEPARNACRFHLMPPANSRPSLKAAGHPPIARGKCQLRGFPSPSGEGRRQSRRGGAPTRPRFA